MAGETNVTLVGNLTADPELRFTPAGAAVAGFTVASTNRIFDKQTNEWRDGDTLFIRCSAWRQLAENCAATLTKGTRVIVTGALKVRDYERTDGTKGTSVEMTVDEIGPSLRNATAQIQKVQRSNGQGNGGQQGGQPQQNTQQRPQQQPQDDPWGGQPAQQQPQGQQDDPWGNSSSEPPF